MFVRVGKMIFMILDCVLDIFRMIRIWVDFWVVLLYTGEHHEKRLYLVSSNVLCVDRGADCGHVG